MESEDLFEEDITEDVVPDFDNEIEEVTEEVEATERAVDEEPNNENESSSPQTETVKQIQEKPTDDKLFHLPLARIRNIMKLDPDLHIASNEAVFCVTRATELFIASMARESFHCTSQTKKKTIQRKDVDKAIETVDTLDFLIGSMF